MRGLVVLAPVALLLGGCATTPAITGWPAVSVTASGETAPVGTAKADAADDPAIWRNPADPAASLIVATDKKAGLHVYDLSGTSRSMAGVGLVNNVDLVDLGAEGVIVVASDRNDPANAALQVFRLNTATARLEPLGRVPGGAGEGYGLCLWNNAGTVHAFSVLKQGQIEEFRLDFAGNTVRSVPVLSRKVMTQPEGCVVDPRTGTLYVGEEGAGVWRYPAGSEQGELILPVDNRMLVADVEGIDIAPRGESGGWLVVSSQGDNAYAVFDLATLAPVGRFRIAAGQFGATEETDGIALDVRSFGAQYPGGLFIAQDGQNAPAAQNFKLVSWRLITEALAQWSHPQTP